MSQAVSQQTDLPGFDMKAGSFTLPTLCIHQDDTEALDRFLAQQIARLPRFFEQAPVVIDLGRYASDEVLENFPVIVGMLRGHGLIPVGVRGASELQKQQAMMLELAIMPALRPAARKEQVATPSSGEARAHPPTQIVDKPVRSGQRIYAQGGDLVITGTVGSGAEIIADGSIHAYGPVSGRLLAGVSGNETARIFCRKLRAELVSIAGRYKVSEDFGRAHIGRSVQISLQGDSLDFASL